ncbi:MAG: Ig-like domain-containing protein [Pirellulaceae bacterium]
MKLCRRGADHRSAQLEFLERRDLLAGDLVAHWVADQGVSASLEDAVVMEWSDRISGISADAFGSPTLINEAMGRRPVVRFDQAGSKDWLQVGKSDNPLSGANDFSVAVLFQSNGKAADGDGVTWNTGTGLVHMNQLGFNDDWGLTLHPDGRISTGLGAGFLGTTTSLFSNMPVTDGQPHLVTMVRSGDTLSLAVDDGPPVTVGGATLNPRVAVDLFFGVGVDSQQVFIGDIAEVRIYDGALDAAEQSALRTELDAYYNNQSPQAFPDQYQVDEDGVLFVLPDNGVLANDVDADGDDLTAEVVSQPGHGEVSFRPNGSIIYSPLPNFHEPIRSPTPQSTLGYPNLPQSPSMCCQHMDPATGVADQYKSTPDRQLNIPLVGGLRPTNHIDNLPMTAVLADGISNVPFTLRPDGGFTPDPQRQAGSLMRLPIGLMMEWSCRRRYQSKSLSTPHRKRVTMFCH